MKFMNEEDRFKMAGVDMSDSGLPFRVWIHYNGADRKVEHNLPKIEVEINHEIIPYLIDDKKPEFLINTSIKGIKSSDMELLNQWIIKNYRTLINHWNGKITDRTALNTLTNIKG